MLSPPLALAWWDLPCCSLDRGIPRKHFWIPAALFIGSDIYLNVWQYQLPFTLDQYIMWAWYLVPCFFGFFLRDKIKPLTVLGAGLGTGIGFFLASNFAVWAFGNIAYAKNLSGLILCYAKAIPFFRNGIISDVLFSLVFFGIGALVAQTQRAYRGQERGGVGSRAKARSFGFCDGQYFACCTPGGRAHFSSCPQSDLIAKIEFLGQRRR